MYSTILRKMQTSLLFASMGSYQKKTHKHPLSPAHIWREDFAHLLGLPHKLQPLTKVTG